MSHSARKTATRKIVRRGAKKLAHRFDVALPVATFFDPVQVNLMAEIDSLRANMDERIVDSENALKKSTKN